MRRAPRKALLTATVGISLSALALTLTAGALPTRQLGSSTSDPVILNGVTASQLDEVPAETDLSRWDIAWENTPTAEFFSLSGDPATTDVIWRGGKTSLSAFADAGWGLILNAFESQNDSVPGVFLYNKTAVGTSARTLQVVARSNAYDGTHLSGRGSLGVKAAFKDGGSYVVETLAPILTEAQVEDTTSNFAITAEDFVTFEQPPLVDYTDTIHFDVSGLAGKSDVVFFLEADDRMDTGTNLGDRVIILAVRLSDSAVAEPQMVMGLTQGELRAVPEEVDRARWMIGPTVPVSTFFAPAPAASTVTWRGRAEGASSFTAESTGLAISPVGEGPGKTGAALLYNKTDIPSNASTLEVHVDEAAAAGSSGSAAIRVRAAFLKFDRYTELTLGDRPGNANADGWLDLDDLSALTSPLSFDLLPLAGRPDVVLFIEAKDLDLDDNTTVDRLLLTGVEIEIAGVVTPAEIVDTTYPTGEVVIADVVAEPSAYAVDPTGVADSTAGIESALRDVFASGGGTVFLPDGAYRVTRNINIPPFTALRGDFNDPDSPAFDGEYGTTILADVDSRDTDFPAVFTVGGSAAVIGLTVFYPEQDADHVKPYPYTFEIPSFAGKFGHGDHMAPTIRDVTLLNAYRGIAASITPVDEVPSAANEMLHLENIQGTVLYRGVELYNSSEYGVVREVSFGNAYWEDASSEYGPPAEGTLDTFTLEHGIGMLMGDLEWVQFTDIRITDYKIGIRLFDGLRRHIPGQPEIYFIGQFHGLKIENAVTGLRIDNMYPEFGVTIADSSIEGSLFSIRNEDTTPSVVKVIGTTLIGDVGGPRVVRTGGESTYATLKTAGDLPTDKAPDVAIPPRRLYNAAEDFGADRTGVADSTSAIQDALDEADGDGGGIVYLPAGFYKVTDALSIGAHTELRGSAASATRDEIGLSRGTLLLADYGYTTSEIAAEALPALIGLDGDSAGVRGLRIFYAGNEPDTERGEIRPHAYTIRGTADDTYVIHASLVGSSYGIQFAGTPTNPVMSPVVRSVSGTYYRVGISLKDTAGAHIEEALANATVVARTGLSDNFPGLVSAEWPSDANGKLGRLYDLITRPNTVFLHLDDAEDTTVSSSFTFGAHTFLRAMDSGVHVINSAGDNLSLTGHLFHADSSELTVVNAMRFQGAASSGSGSTVNIFNRLSLRDVAEQNLVAGSAVSSTTITPVVKSGDDLPAPYSFAPPYDVINGVTNATLDRLPPESNLQRWDIPWGGTSTSSFFDFGDSPVTRIPIWRGGHSANSVFADAGWGLIMNGLEAATDDAPAAFIYNKTDVPGASNVLQVIARSNAADVHVSGRGAMRVKAATPNPDGTYDVVTLEPTLSSAQTADTVAQFATTTSGWVTFEAPPTADATDAFAFDLGDLSGQSDVSFVIETNDRMEPTANRADRVIVLAVRIP